ncbi:MAG: hypothetical protein IPG93_10255 [Burkholderiales bacterium]|nr:hypothetical protein [Burkholderiales bacterium]
MHNNNDRELRQRAEAALSQRTPIDRLSDGDTVRLLHELKVHQIELEMQNEALRQAQADGAETMHRLVVACEVAEAASRAKTVFLSTMSHELRTPLSGVLGMLHLARKRATDAKQIEWLGKCDSAARHLLVVINDVLDITRIEAARLMLEQTDVTLDTVMGNVQNLVAPLAADKSIALELDLAAELVDRTLVGDPTRLEQILLNLVGNAVKFTSAGYVAVHAFPREETSTDVLIRFEVTDTGIGISAEDQTRLFHAFEQVDGSIARKFGGSGLGLTICKHLAELMGGAIGVRSVAGQGSTFWFTARLGKRDLPDAP